MSPTDTSQASLLSRSQRRSRGALLLTALLLVALGAGAVLFSGAERGGRLHSLTTAGAAESAPGAAPGSTLGASLSWSPPELEDPEVIEISPENLSLKLELTKDYRLVMPERPLTHSLSVYGGRNVVLIGGEIRIESGDGEGARGLYLRDQTGTVHVEGLLLSGEKLAEGINLDQRLGAVVQLQNIRIEGVDGSRDGHHADLLQSWAGPRQLLIDGLSGETGYQGFFLLPQQFGDQEEPEIVDLRRVDIAGDADGSAYMLWRDDAEWPVVTDQVWVAPTVEDLEDRPRFLWDRAGEDSWKDVRVGLPPDGSFVPPGSAGVGYESPGYGTAG